MKPAVPVGLLAGSGRFPTLFCEKALARGIPVFAAAFFGQTEKAGVEKALAVEWFHLGEVGRVLSWLRENSVRDMVFLGGIKKPDIYSDIRLDPTAVRLLSSISTTHDDDLLRTIASFIESEGIRVRPSTWLLPELLAPKGVWTKREPTPLEWRDIGFGFSLAKKIGALDVGQCVVVADRCAVAVEAMEGTDAAIRRAGTLRRGNIVVVKVKKPIQDTRFDLPAAGVETIKSMMEAGASVLALEAGASVVIDREEMIALADLNNIAVVGVTEEMTP